MELLAPLALLFIYVGLPLAVIILLGWVYQIKKNSDTYIKQNQRIIQLLEDISRQ
ncbi:hypothetical protein ACUL41_17900 [Virgibacillus natechei]